MTAETLTKALRETWESRDSLREAVRKAPPANGTERVLEIIEEIRKK